MAEIPWSLFEKGPLEGVISHPHSSAWEWALRIKSVGGGTVCGREEAGMHRRTALPEVCPAGPLTPLVLVRVMEPSRDEREASGSV